MSNILQFPTPPIKDDLHTVMCGLEELCENIPTTTSGEESL